jgi:signal peptidase I
VRAWIRDNRGFIVFLALFGLFRTAVADWNPIPSGSMRPNLLEGDVVLVNRLAFDLKLPLTDIVVTRLGEPRRGDIVTFSSPKDGTRLIKRLIALPGDTVEMRAKQLRINGEPADYAITGSPSAINELPVQEALTGEARRIQWLTPHGPADDFGPLVVPANHYLMLGDNRDNSADSRYFGFVPRNLLIGRAERVLVSADILDKWQPRFGRFGQRLHRDD